MTVLNAAEGEDGARLPRPAGMSRTRRRQSVLAVITIAALALAGCSSSSKSNGSAGSSTGVSGTSSTGNQAADTSAAQAAIAPYIGQPSAFPVTEPLSKPLPPGAKFVYLQCATPVCGLAGQLLKGAVASLGASFSVINAGVTAASSQAAASSALALKPDAVIITGEQPSQYGDGLKKLSAAGIKVISISIGQDVKPFGITFNFIGAATDQLAGKLLADWVIAKKGDGAHIVFYGVPALDFSTYMQQTFQDTIHQGCPSCDLRTVPVDIATIGTTASHTVVSDLQAHASTNVAVFSTCDITSGLPAGLKTAGLNVTTLCYAPAPATLADIKSGGIDAGLGADFPVGMWTSVDAAARLILGDQPTATEQAGAVPFQFLEQKDITFDPQNGWTGYPDFPQRFAKLWHPAR